MPIRVLLAFSLVLSLQVLAGCESVNPIHDSEINCGSMTCGPGEYCYEECLCCGSDSGGAADSEFSCRSIPDDCDTNRICDCDHGISSASCNGDRQLMTYCS
jgi:hypothetical protein